MSKRSHEFRWKQPNESGSKIPSWKETYRQRCMDRLRDSRFKHLLAKRQTEPLETDDIETEDKPVKTQSMKDKVLRDIQTMMSTEWDLVQREDAANKGIEPENIQAPSVDEMIELMEDILEELRVEKLRQSNEETFCDEFVREEEEELCQAFHRLNAVEVICPMCQKNCLEEGMGRISCKCGLNIDTEQDCISLKYVSDNLRSGMVEHGEQCEQEPTFSQMDNFGISTLIMSCQKCSFQYVII